MNTLLYTAFLPGLEMLANDDLIQSTKSSSRREVHKKMNGSYIFIFIYCLNIEILLYRTIILLKERESYEQTY